MLKHYFPTGGPIASQMSQETSLSVWIAPSVALQSGFQPSFETSLSVLVESGVALWEGTQA